MESKKKSINRFYAHIPMNGITLKTKIGLPTPKPPSVYWTNEYMPEPSPFERGFLDRYQDRQKRR